MENLNFTGQTIVSDDAGDEFGREIADEIKTLTNDYTVYLQRLHALDTAQDWTAQDIKRKNEIVLRIAQKLGIDAELQELREFQKEREQRFRDALDANNPPEREKNA